jgi:hypothetical protein
MLHRHLVALAASVVLLTGGATQGRAQNLLIDGGFESLNAPVFGDNIDVDITPWLKSSELDNLPYLKYLSLVKTDPSGTMPLATAPQPMGGPAWVTQMPQSDGSNNPMGQYLRLQGLPASYLRIGQRALAPYTGCVKFGGKFAVKDELRVGNPVTLVVLELPQNAVDFLNGQPSNYTSNFPITDPAWGMGPQKLRLRLDRPNPNVWKKGWGFAQVTQGRTYSFVSVFSAGNAIDDMYVRYVYNSNCPGLPSGTPNPPSVETSPPLDLNQTSITKSCMPISSAVHNGQVGQMWNCQVNVSVPETPFAGTFGISDVFTPNPNLTSEIVSAQSVSGNFSCLGGSDCTIDGADFAATGLEQVDYQIFVASTSAQNSYAIQNCVEGSYDDGTGNVAPVSGNCVDAQWTPRKTISKTCEDIAPGSTAPYTVTCQVQVTAHDLPTDSYVAILDVFMAIPPAVATVNQSFMNVTSTENWSCIDTSLNTPASIGICELSALDMLNAGGTSTLDVTFQFNSSEAPAQAANCRYIDVTDLSPIAAAGTQRRAPPNPIVPNQGALPDICVSINIPAPPEPPQVERASLTKTCEAPVAATHQGAQGYIWDCRAEIVVNPTPFAGSFFFDDDASNISIGAAQFISTTEPGCAGVGTDRLQCQLDGNTMSAPHVIGYRLFTGVIDPNQPIVWENCAQGVAQSTEGKTPTEKQCVEIVIKPAVTTNPKPEKLALEKSCGRVFSTTHDGVQGLGWNCQIKVTAMPAPFVGSFTFTEDATGVSGSNNANIIGVFQPSNQWTCAPGTPTQSTQCTILGADFNPSGVETIGFQLFAQAGDTPIDWINCASGTYTDPDGKPRNVRGNCVTWKPPVRPVPPTFVLKKGCKGPSPYENGQRYACTINVSQTGGDPITSPITLAELFSNTNGNPALDYLILLQSTPGWVCEQPNFANGATCTIQPSDFNGVTGHSITGFFVIPNTVLAAQNFQNCATLTMNDQTMAAADCVDLDNPLFSEKPIIDLIKTCSPARRSTKGQWTVACKLIITGQNLPTGQPVSITDDLMSSLTQTALSGQMLIGSSPCSTGVILGGISTLCEITTDDIIAAGGTLTVPFSGTYQGPVGRPINGVQAQNCAFVQVPSWGLQGPTTGNGKSCVPVTFPISVGGGKPILDPALPDRTIGMTGGLIPLPHLPSNPTPNPIAPIPTLTIFPSLTIFKEQTSACIVNRDRQTYQCGFRLSVINTGGAPYDAPLVVTDNFGTAGVQKVTVVSGNATQCARPMGGVVSCHNPQLKLARGGVYRIDLSMVVSGLRKGGAFNNCAATGISDNRAQRVAAIQQAMNTRGLNAGPVDGRPGDKTYSALAQLQQSLGLPVSRAFDDTLFAALGLQLQKPGEESCVVVNLPAMPTPPKAEPPAKPAPKPAPTPAPKPVPDAPALKCDKASTRQRGDQCVCIDQRNAKKLSPTQCGCTNGLPMINGLCIPIDIAPKPQGDGPADAEKCLIMLNGICIK